MYIDRVDGWKLGVHGVFCTAIVCCKFSDRLRKTAPSFLVLSYIIRLENYPYDSNEGANSRFGSDLG